jgi:putative transposase
VLREWTQEQTGIELEVVYPWWRQLQRYFPQLLEETGFQSGFHVLPRRWVVERTFAWLGRYRRLSKDDERVCETTETLILIAMVRLMLRRLAGS